MNRVIIVLALTVFLLVPLAPSKAAGSDKEDDPTTQREKGVFAFFSLGSEPPDVEMWVSSSDEYNGLPYKYKEDYLISQSIRLGTGYGLFDPQKDLLNIRAVVLVHYTGPAEGKPGRVYFQFPNQKKDYIPTFSYPYIKDEWVSLIINKLALFSDIPLSVEHYDTVKEHLLYEDQMYEGVLTIQVRPTEADHSKPIKIGSLRQWIMIGEIAYMKCEVDSDKNGQRQQLWDYVAPWYEDEYRLLVMPEDLKYPHPYDLKK